jgi:hypothetical protein
MSLSEERHAAYVGQRVLAAMLRARAASTLRSLDDTARLTADADDDVSVEVIVWGDTDDGGGGGVDVLQLDPWMFEAHIEITVPFNLPGPAGPAGGGNDNDPADPCTKLGYTLEDLNTALGAQQDALGELQRDLDDAGSAAEKKAIRAEIRKVKDEMAETRKAIDDVKASQKAQGCT